MLKKICYNASMFKCHKPIFLSACLSLSLFAGLCLTACQHSEAYAKRSTAPEEQDQAYQTYLDTFEEVYQTMKDHYYQDVDRVDYERFLKQFNSKIYAQLQEKGKSIDFIRWRSAAYLVDFLKTEEDIFSAFYPPKPAKEYEKTALGKRQDLGIEGTLTGKGFAVSHVEPRSDAYAKGLRPEDTIVGIDGDKVTTLTEEEINKRLVPFIDTTVHLRFMSAADQAVNEIDVISQEYFKQTVFMIPIPVDGIYGLEIQRFNRKTSEDMLRFLEAFRRQGPIRGLILDLRGNPGGPPLAAREISSFFLPGGDDFAYFRKRGQAKAELDVPTIPSRYKYEGPMVILIDQKSGSASELFSGILQKRGRAVLLGRNSAGQVMLKSMFDFEDESMLLLITGRGYHPDGTVFRFTGLEPDKRIKEDQEDEIMKYATSYLLYMQDPPQTEGNS